MCAFFKKLNVQSLAFHTLVPLMLSFIIAMLVPDYQAYYASLIKPFPVIPSIVFPIVWSILYLLMGFAAYLVEQTVWTQNKEEFENYRRKAMNYYYLQLIVNLLWTPMFFWLKAPLIAAVWTVLLLFLVYRTTVMFFRINQASGYLMMPYFLWVVFATYLTIAFWVLNM